MSARLLLSPPVSGTIKERHYEATGTCTWVEFTPEIESPWVGVFGHHGISTHSGVFEFENAPFAFVIAAGIGWIVNDEDGSLAYQTNQDCLVTALPLNDHALVVAADWTHLYLYSLHRLIWSSDRIALDGIRFDNTANGVVNGRCWQSNGWYAFQFNTDSCTVSRGRFITSRWE